MPQRLQLRRTKGWRKPEGAVVVARPSKWGNPFVVGDPARASAQMRPTPLLDGYADGVPITITPDLAVALFRSEWEACLAEAAQCIDPDDWAETLDALRELRGKDLACWCPLDQPCHADVLLELANGPEVA